MIPCPNVIAGILIGAFNQTWLSRLLIPFFWGIIFCLSKIIFDKEDMQQYISYRKDEKAKWNMSPKQAYFFIEYMTSLTTALLFSIVSGFLKDIFF
jgi:hypothetical protein